MKISFIFFIFSTTFILYNRAMPSKLYNIEENLYRCHNYLLLTKLFVFRHKAKLQVMKSVGQVRATSVPRADSLAVCSAETEC